MPDRTVTVKAAGGDYQTLNAALAGELAGNPDLVSMGGILTVECYSLGADDTTAATTSTGWTTDSSHYLRIVGAPSEKPGNTGKWSTSRYRLVVTDANALTIGANYTRVEDLQVQVAHTTSTSRSAIVLTNSAQQVRILRCGVRMTFSVNVSDHPRAFHFPAASGSGPHYVVNCWAYDVKRGTAPAYGQGVRMGGSGVLNVYNCTFQNCNIAIIREAGTVNAINNGMASCTTGLSGTMNTDVSNLTTSPSFVDEAGDNFHLLGTDTAWLDQGDGSTPRGVFTDDVDGNGRPATDLDWDVGYHEWSGRNPVAMGFVIS